MSAPTTQRQRAVRNVGWSAVERWFARVAGMATFVVLGRLLGPEDIGLATLAVAAVGFLGVLSDFGLSTFVVQATDADRRTTSTVFWTALVLGSVAAAVVLLTAGPIAALVGEPGAEPVLRALAAGLVMSSLTCVPAALLVRRMRFRAMAVRGVVAAAVSAVVGIALAATGAGVWALVAQHLALSLVTLVWFWSAARWLPSFTVSRQTLRELSTFGTALLGINLVQAVRDRADQFVVGGVGGIEVLGYWAVATRVLAVVQEVTMTVMDHVALPLFVGARDDEARFERAYETAGAMSTAVLAPVVAVLAATTPVLLPTLFGAQWQPSVLPAQVLCIAYGVGAVGYFNRSALLAHGRAGLAGAVAAGSLLVHVTVLVAAAPYGAVALAGGFSVGAVVIVAGSAVVLRRTVGVAYGVYGRSVLALAAAAASTVPMFLMMSVVPGLTGAVLAGAVGTAAYVGLMALVNRRLVVEGWRDVHGALRR